MVIKINNNEEYMFSDGYMKFPHKLSKERLAVLSPEDRKIYESEHNPKKQELFEDEDMIFSNPDSFENDFMFDSKSFIKNIISEELDKMYSDSLENDIDYDSYIEMKDSTMNYLENFEDDDTELLNEAVGGEGLDAYAWVKSLSFGKLGTLAMSGLALLGTAIATLLVTGKDKIAIEKLKYYMNRLVEIVDQGIHKKKPWYAFLFRKGARQNMGERNMACFRTVQETADRNMTNSIMSAAHKLGYFGTGHMMNISNSDAPQDGGGLQAFNANVLSKLTAVIDKD